MKLMTKAIEKMTPAMDASDGTTFEEKTYTAKFFDPCGRGAWFMCEYDPVDRIAFGYIVSPLGPDCDEGGYFSLAELEGVRNRLGLGIERDIHWKPGKLPKEVLNVQ